MNEELKEVLVELIENNEQLWNICNTKISHKQFTYFYNVNTTQLG